MTTYKLHKSEHIDDKNCDYCQKKHSILELYNDTKDNLICDNCIDDNGFECCSNCSVIIDESDYCHEKYCDNCCDLIADRACDND